MIDLEAERAILLLLGVLRGIDKTDLGLMPVWVCGFRHLATCGHGQWNQQDSPRPHGDPCSDRCERAQEAIEAGVDWLKANERPVDQQPSMFEVAG